MFKKLVILLAIAFLFQQEASAFNNCGSFGPTQWLNTPAASLMTYGIGSPLGLENAAFPQFFKFLGAQNFAGFSGCTPSSVEYKDNSATYSYDSDRYVVSAHSSDPIAFTDLEATYTTCSFEGNEITLISQYVATSGGYPNGVQYSFTYDEQCRPTTVVQATTTGSVLTTFGFTYGDSENPQLPTSVSAQAAYGTSVQNYDYTEFVTIKGKKLISKFVYTVPASRSSPTVENWSIKYNSAGLMTSATVSRSSMAGTSTFFFKFNYDSDKRWTKVFSGIDPNSLTLGITATYERHGSSSRTTMTHFQGPDSQFDFVY